MVFKRTAMLAVLWAVFPFSASAEDIAISSTFNSVSTISEQAQEFANKCLPTSAAAFLKMVRDAGTASTVVTRNSDRLKPFLVVNGTRTICVAQSPKGYPVLPTEVFDQTINFNDMPAEDQKALQTSLARQLALTGAANALIKTEAGNAMGVYYMFSSDNPLKFYYHLAFLKLNEIDESKFAFVTSTKGPVSSTARNQPPESFKPLYQK